MEARKLALIGVFASLSFAVMFVEFPIIPAASFLKYDPSEVFALLGAVNFGLGGGILVVVMKDLLFYFAKSGDIVGILMNVAAGVFFIIPAWVLWRRSKVLAGVVSVSVVSAAMIGLNAFVVPLYFKAPFSLFLEFIPWIALFNAVKFTVNFVLTVFLNRYVERIIRLV